MNRKILVVDDDSDIALLLKTSLETEGYTVVVATDGSEALENVAAHKPDLVVMDVMMPHMDGFEAVEKMKNDPEMAFIPVILLTAKDQDTDVAKGWRKGTDYYWTKPFDAHELTTFIGAVFKGFIG